MYTSVTPEGALRAQGSKESIKAMSDALRRNGVTTVEVCEFETHAELYAQAPRAFWRSFLPMFRAGAPKPKPVKFTARSTTRKAK